MKAALGTLYALILIGAALLVLPSALALYRAVQTLPQ